MKKIALTVLKITLFFVGWALTLAMDIPPASPPVWRFFAEAGPLLSMILFTAAFVFIEKGKVKIPLRHHAVRGALTGIAVGLVWIGLSAGILLLTHQLMISGKNDVDMPGLWILSAFLNVVMQELLARGYIYQLLKTTYGLPAAVIVSTALFTLMHGGAFEAGLLPVMNVVTMCLLTTVLYEAEGTILAPIMAHAAWNIIGGVILGGVSLADDYPSVFSMAPSENVILSGGSLRIEGSIVVLIMNIALALIILARNQKKTQENRLPQ
ncbi:MAG: type II CAAX endopeptidase family protein [Lachnospiraceae bacterium]|uniref:CPBP family intramembrane glutamic endopeptidase n=1 Tax=Galactobacillus timonensis TaxID=2041840 RepID=UPI0023F51F45|nr:type II CAAX endopeptidase family protein [Galactobacillus timonensis]MCI6754718.1 CPBP family intramembrane metalloprotease [Galactobacillus timonensis]MDD7087523.1 type II CAAX endopeptidase family protein [Galactobacillus timonensis]MDY5222401.1 type II CAAX endopeptidase family protein [Lachnospiraceae bacterium]